MAQLHRTPVVPVPPPLFSITGLTREQLQSLYRLLNVESRAVRAADYTVSDGAVNHELWATLRSAGLQCGNPNACLTWQAD